jgi:hypothetical protein
VDLSVDRPDVLAEHSDEEELHCAEEVDADQQGRESELELVPEQELGDQVAHGHEQADDRDGETGHRREAERHLGVIGDAQHRHVVEAEEVVLRAAAVASRLHIRDLGPLVPEVADETAEIRVLLVRVPHQFDHVAVVEPESREVLDEFHIGRQRSDEAVVEPPRLAHQPRVAGAFLDADHDFVALFPLGNELWDELGRILEVGDDAHDGVASRLQESVER